MSFPFEKMYAIKYQDDFFRNIKTIRNTQNLYDDLSDEPVDWESAHQLERNSKPKQYLSEPLINRPFEEANFFNAIAFPFSTENWRASRYSDGSYGVWYGAIEFDTTIFETVHHWKKFLAASNFDNHPLPIIGERRVFKVKCDALLYDFSDKIKEQPLLSHPNYYSLTQGIGEYLQNQGHPGLLSPSARCQGKIAAIFKAKVLSDPRDYCYLRYRFEPKSQITEIERSPGQVLFKVGDPSIK